MVRMQEQVNKAMPNSKTHNEKKNNLTTSKKRRFTLLNFSFFILAISLIALCNQIYTSIFLPYSGYGDADMEYLAKELPESLSAGDLTHFHSKEKAFEQEAPNLSWGLSAAFDRGDGIFERPYAPAETSRI